MDSEYFAKKFIQLFPEYKQEYVDHLETYNEVLGHVFFADVVNIPLFDLLSENTDKQAIQKYIDFFEDMYANGDITVQDIVRVTFLAYLGDDDVVLRNAFAYFSVSLISVSKEVESVETGYGRRDIRIWHKRKSEC